MLSYWKVVTNLTSFPFDVNASQTNNNTAQTSAPSSTDQYAIVGRLSDLSYVEFLVRLFWRLFVRPKPEP